MGELERERGEINFPGLDTHSSEIISVLGADGESLFVGPSVKPILGYDPDQIRAADPFSLLHPADEPRAWELLKIALNDSEQAWTDEFRMRHADGAWRDFECVARNMLQEPTVGGVVFNLRDVTERRKSEDALAQFVAERNMILENARISIYLTKDSRVVRGDAAFEKMFGWNVSDEPRGVDMNSICADPDKYKKLGEALVQTFADGRTFEHEILMKRKNGTTFWCRSVGKAVNPSDLSEGSMWLAEDINDRKLAKEELRQAQKMEAVGQLGGGVAHDFNNLLAVVMLSLELIEEQIDMPSDFEVLIGRARGALKHGENLTQRLLSFSRRQALQPYPCDLNILVAGMLEIFRRTITAEIEISSELSRDLWQVKVDPGQLQDAILNLVLNARDALPDGGKVTLLTENRRCKIPPAGPGLYSEQEDFVVFSVVDTGLGMSPDILELAPEQFFTTKETVKGSGLGLSMVFGFANQFGGHLTIQSEVGRGTCVSIFLPRYAETESAGIDDTKRDDTPSVRGETILVVEDDSDLRELAALTLESLGYEVLQAANVEIALRILAGALAVDLVLSDVVLPGGMNGVDLVTTARARWPDLKCLFMSGYTALPHGSMPDDVALLNKPFRREELARKVSEALLPSSI